jgi:hypothetical protein
MAQQLAGDPSIAFYCRFLIKLTIRKNGVGGAVDTHTLESLV